MGLSELELTDEYSNYFMTSFISLFNNTVNGEKLSKIGFIRALRKASDTSGYPVRHHRYGRILCRP